MSTSSDWIKFLFEERTDTWIAERAGIPRSTVGFVRRGERDLGSQYFSGLRSAYQSETIRRLDAVGMPHRESFRFSMSSPERQHELAASLDTITHRLAARATASSFWESGEDYGAFDWDGVYADYVSSITESIHYSPYSYEDIEDRYGTPR